MSGATCHSDRNYMCHQEMKGRSWSEAEERRGDAHMHASLHDRVMCKAKTNI